MINPFFRNSGPFKISDILQLINLDDLNIDNDQKIIDIKDLFTSKKNDITFFHSKKYKDIAKNTKASFCLTTKILKDELPKSCTPLVVENVLVSTSKVTSKFYPSSINDSFDYTAKDINETHFKNKVKYGKNVLIGDNVTLGSNCLIGHNTIIEQNVSIGENCSIGSNVIIRNTLINNNVTVLDNCVIGKHGFGFFPINEKNLRYPHIGIVIIGENSEIGCGCTIDRGSMSNTVIGKNTYIGAGSKIAADTKIGDNIVIGALGFVNKDLTAPGIYAGLPVKFIKKNKKK